MLSRGDRDMSDLHIVAGLLLFLVSLNLMTSGVPGIAEEGSVVNASNVSACQGLDENSSLSSTIGCSFDSSSSYLSLVSLSSQNAYLDALYKLIGSVLFLYVLVNVILPIVRAIAEAIPL